MGSKIGQLPDTGCLGTLGHFIGQVEYHAPGDFPVKLIFFANGELYEIVYAASGQEALINHALRDDRSGGRRIILIDNPEDIRRIDCPGISGFCTVDEAGQVHYFKKQEELDWNEKSSHTGLEAFLMIYPV